MLFLKERGSEKDQSGRLAIAVLPLRTWRILALGMCTTCYAINRKMRNISPVCGSRCSSGTALAA